VSGGQGTPTGSVTFTLYSGNSVCSGDGVTSGSLPLSGGSASSGDTTVPAGGLSYKAHYLGDATYTAKNGERLKEADQGGTVPPTTAAPAGSGGSSGGSPASSVVP